MNTPTEEPLSEMEYVDHVIGDTNALAVSNAERERLVATLKPIADKINNALIFADQIKVTNEQEAKDAAVSREVLVDYAEQAENAIRSFDNNLVERLFKTHRAWTALIGRFAVLNDAARKIKQKVMSWQAEEEEKARKEQARLQAEADERARAEQERLRKQAEKLKTPELREQRLEQAAQVTAPVVYVAPPARAVKAQSRWFVKSIDRQAFIEAAAKDKSLIGYIDIDSNKLARGKAANSELSIPGIVFESRLV